MRSLEKKILECCWRGYERAAIKGYSYSRSGGIDVSWRCHSAVLGHRIAFRVRQQESLGCRPTAADARLSCENRADRCVTHRRVGWNVGRLRERADSASGQRISYQAELQRRRASLQG